MLARRALTSFLVAVSLSGCLSEPLAGSTTSAEESISRVRPVIAVLDSGLTPYLNVLASPGFIPPASITTPFETVHLTPGGTLRDDWPIWQNLTTGRLYHFADTRAFGISIIAEEELPPLVDDIGHGTSVTHLAARDSPHAIILLIQIRGTLCVGDPNCIIHPSVADGMEWIADQDWIDVVSVSMGITGNPPDPDLIHPDARRFIEASERAAASGKLVVFGAGNSVAPPLMSYFAGPPWVISVGGFQNHRNGEALVAAKAVDVVANFSELVPTGDDQVLTASYGTSLGAPQVAATFAEAIHILRAANGEAPIDPAAMRAALNASAALVGPSDWDPRPPQHGNPVYDLYGLNAPILLQPQIGWGYVNASLAPEIARRVLEGDLAPPAEKSQAAAFQPAWQRAREEFWAAYSR